MTLPNQGSWQMVKIFLKNRNKPYLELNFFLLKDSQTKKPKPVLEKSKLVVVNLTPKPGSLQALNEEKTFKPAVSKIEEQNEKHFHETPDPHVNYIINSTGNNELASVNLIENPNISKIKLNNSNRLEKTKEELKLNENQTPVSTSFKSKTNIERIIEADEELLIANKKEKEKETVHIQEESNRNQIKPIKKNSRSELINEVLTVQSSNYYNQVLQKERNNSVDDVEHRKESVQVQTVEHELSNRNKISTETQTEVKVVEENVHKEVAFNLNEKEVVITLPEEKEILLNKEEHKELVAEKKNPRQIV